MKVVYIVQGFEANDPMSGRLSDSVEVEVYANTEKDAITKAKKYIKKKYFRVSRVIEIDPELKK